MTARLTNDQLRSQANYHRKLAGQFRGPTHSTQNIDGQITFYQLTQQIMAEVYEELLEHRLSVEHDQVELISRAPQASS